MSSNVPLVVDLDGTYLKTDTLHELLMLAIRRPGVFFRAFVAYTRSGKAAAKRVLAENLQLDVSLLPMNPEVAEFATTASQDGRLVLLASGADAQIVNAFIDGNHPFSEGISSDGVVNLTGARKAEALVDRFGRGGFDYVGNERADIDVWAASRKKYLASNSGSVPRSIRSIDFEAVLSAHGRTPFRAWVKAIRPHQSAKNILVFLPLLAAHQINSVQAWLAMLAGYLVFSMMASSVYLLNDALDLSSDRQHTKKRRRPMASGDILPLYAVLGSLALAVLALGVGLLLGIPFFSVLLFYTATTIAYSFWLKRITLVDVLVLALLYMVRIFAGAALAGIELSFWFIAVTTFLFISLAFAKRFAEVSAATHATAKIPGRGYQPNDGSVLSALGIGSAIATVMFLASYIQSSDVLVLYQSPQTLWIVVPLVFYWLANLWVSAGRGEMNEDPVIFALKNRASVICAALVFLTFVAATLPAIRMGN